MLKKFNSLVMISLFSLSIASCATNVKVTKTHTIPASVEFAR